MAGQVLRNSLPAAVREADSLYSFKCKLETHLLTLCFNGDGYLFIYFLKTFVLHSRSVAE